MTIKINGNNVLPSSLVYFLVLSASIYETNTPEVETNNDGTTTLPATGRWSEAWWPLTSSKDAVLDNLASAVLTTTLAPPFLAAVAVYRSASNFTDGDPDGNVGGCSI